MFVSLLNLIMTDMVFLKKDAYITFWAGCFYIPFNYGSSALLGPGHDYPIGDWVNVPFTICFYICAASFMVICHYLAAIVSQRISGYKEDPY